MRYCRKCGAEIDDDARFCRVCGTPVESYGQAPSPYTYEPRSHPLPWPLVGALIAILIVAVVVAGLAFLPVQNVNYTKTNTVPADASINSIYLGIDADVANINVVPTRLQGQLVQVNVSATGAVGVFASTTEPVKVEFNSVNSNGTSTVTCKISQQASWSLNNALTVTCNVYIDPSAALNVQVSTSVGKIQLTSDTPVTFQAVNLHSTTGSVSAAFTDSTFSGPITATTTTGAVKFTSNNCRLIGDRSLTLTTTTGSVDALFAQDQSLEGNLTCNVASTTGSVRLDLQLSGAIAAQITSHTSTGHISTDVQNFNGNQSPIYSNNYPADSNILANLSVTTGNINIHAVSEALPSGNPF